MASISSQPRLILAPEDTAFRTFIRTFGLLERAMQPYFARFGISGSQWGVLRQLHRAETEGRPGLRMTELSHRLLIRLPSATGVIDRLVRDRLVTRVSLPEDLRVKQIALTHAGRQKVLEILKVHDGQMARILGGLNLPEQAEFHRLLTQLRHHLEGIVELEEGSNGSE